MSGEHAAPINDDLIVALLANVPFDGWTRRALRAAARDTGQDPSTVDLIEPNSVGALIEAYVLFADRQMLEEAARRGIPGQASVSGRVRSVLELRLEQSRPYKEAIRRALAVLLKPNMIGVSRRTLKGTVDAIWKAAGDRSSDFSWYTKRATLGTVYSATLFYWVRDGSEGDADTRAFLGRRLADLARFGRITRRLPGRTAPAA